MSIEIKSGVRAVPARESGFSVPGHAKALVKLSSPSGEARYVASQNLGKLLVFAPKKQAIAVVEVAQDVMAV